MKNELQELGRHVYFRFDHVVILRKQQRRDSDQRLLAGFQARMMDGRVTHDDYIFWKKQTLDKKPDDFLKREGVTYLVARREEKDHIDREMLARASRESGMPIITIKATYSSSKARKAKADDKPSRIASRSSLVPRSSSATTSFLKLGCATSSSA
mmetsp:Transcript_3448/g.13341  ORF Transcript_3448/g.13341 Transcript_3448/m.13341 type:complete len:155 (+) Transcript_3448:1466-1930(+)